MDLDALHSFTFKQLKKKCISKGLSTQGNKKQLIVRLKLYYSTNGHMLSPKSVTTSNEETKWDFKNIANQIINSNNKHEPIKQKHIKQKPHIEQLHSPAIHTKAKSDYTHSQFKDVNIPNFINVNEINQIHSKSKSEYTTLAKAVSQLSLNLEDIDIYDIDNNENKSENIVAELQSNTEYDTLSPLNKHQLRRTRSRNIAHNENKTDEDIYSIRITNRGMGLGFAEETGKVVVSEVLQNSRAMFLGISKNDILLKINDVIIESADEYYDFKLPFTATFQHLMKQKASRANSMPPIKKLKMFNKNSLQITDYIVNKSSLFQFDTFQIYKNRIGVCFVVSKWYICPKWKIRVLKCDSQRQEIGIVSNVNDFKISNDGLINSNELGARCFFGTDNKTQVYYASINENGTQRSYNNMNNNNKFYLHEGDVIKITLNVKKWNVCFYINDIKVKKAISIETNQIYYPVISFIGNCKYEIC